MILNVVEKEAIKDLKEEFLPGTIIIFEGTTRERSTIPIGMTGMVQSIDYEGVVHVRWPYGYYSSLINGVDKWRIFRFYEN